jgi:FMN phosphatase YigB (HAD superfamily)
VGDLYDVDTLGARSAGLNGIWLDRSKKATTVHVPPIINSLDELPDIIDALEHGRTSSEK